MLARTGGGKAIAMLCPNTNQSPPDTGGLAKALILHTLWQTRAELELGRGSGGRGGATCCLLGP